MYGRTLGDVVKHGYKGYCLNLRNFRQGVSWNPLALPYRYYHNGKKTKAMEFATEMAKMIIGEEMTEDAFWPTTAIDVVCGFILLLFERASEEECHFKSLLELWNSYTFVEFLSQEGVDLQQLAEEKNAIYLIIPDENTTYHLIVSLFLEQLYEVLLEKAQKEPLQKLPIRMNFLVDEFANIPKIQNMDAMITAARSRNIRFHLIVQGMRQLQQKYGEGADTISGNCNNWIYLYSKEYGFNMYHGRYWQEEREKTEKFILNFIKREPVENWQY